MSSIPTAEELLLEIMSCLKMDYDTKQLNDNDPSLVPYLLEKINDRTKLHVQAALSAAADNAFTIDDPFAYTGNTGSEYPVDQVISKKSILNAYSLENIK